METKQNYCCSPSAGLGVSSLFDSFFQEPYFGFTQRAEYPLCNVEWSKEKANLTFELPGVGKEDISIEIEDALLTISGERKLPYTGKVLKSESFAGKFSRKFRLPYSIETSTVEATLKDGLLKLTLHRKEETKPKKIEISIS